MATITGENIEIYEAVVIDNIDAKALGRIKCCIASEMDSTITPTNILPYIKPLFGGNNFSIPKNGSKVWVFKNTKALDDYRYWPMPDNTDDITDYIAHNNDENTKVIMANDNGYSKSLLTYDDKRGFVMQTNINSIFNLNPQGGYSLVSGNSYFVAKNNHYEIGENASEQAVLGNKLKDLLVTLSEGLKNLSITAAGNPYTTSLSQPIFDISKQINDALNTILSDNITIE
jgi:ABC-type glycerol-3-phosphate transport system substrate-binding protein